MSVSVTFNGTVYLIPTTGETGWDTQLTAFLSDVGNNATTSAGSQTLSNKILKAQSGSANSPSITFNSDATTGLYLPSADQLGFATGGVQALKIDAGQNVTANAALTSTGTLTASATLAVAGTAALASNLTVAGTATVTGTLTASTGITTGTLTATGATSLAALTATGASSLAALSASGAVTGAGFSALTANMGRNFIHNPLFRFVQRGVGPFTATGYTLDRWVLGLTGDAASITQTALADADRTAIGDETADFALQNVFTGASSAADFTLMQQRIETIHRLSNKTVTVSFYAKAATGTPKVGVSIDQNFGSGGSTAVNGSGTAVAISTTWTRYTVTLTIASATGKTVGAGNNTALNLWYSSAATNATRSGTVGVQSGTISIWGVQLEIGSLATTLEKPDLNYDLANCSRFCQIVYVALRSAYTATANFWQSIQILPMYTTPTTTLVVTGLTANVSSFLLSPISNASLQATMLSAGAGDAYFIDYGYLLSADL